MPELVQLLPSLPWRFAKTYAERAPHEYIVRTPAIEEAYVALWTAIEQHGTNAKFGPYRGRYLNLGDGFKYWHMTRYVRASRVLNRDKIIDPDLWPTAAAG